MFIIVPLIWIIWINCSEYTQTLTHKAKYLLSTFFTWQCIVCCVILHCMQFALHYTHTHAHITIESNVRFTLPVAMIRSYLASAWLDSFPWNHTRVAGIRLIRQVNSQYFCSISVACVCVFWRRVRNAKKTLSKMY